MTGEFLKQIQETIERYEMLQLGDRVVVGVSGGADSMALLTALYRLKDHYQLSLWAAYYNHKLRGEESDREEEFVNIQTKKFGIPLTSEEDDGSLLQSQSNLEEIARKKRYDFFQRVALEIGAQKVALGHTANDQVETFFLWIFRGTGTKGLGGIPPVREDIFIRPLIEVGRKEIIEFLQQERIPWVEDSSNQKRKYLRNRIRHILIPKLLDEFDPQLIEKVVKTTEILRSEDLFLEKLSFLSKSPYVANLRGVGLAIAFDIVDPISKLPSDKLAKIFVSQCLEERVISYACGVNFNSVKIIPSLVVTNEEIDIITERLGKCLQRFHDSVK